MSGYKQIHFIKITILSLLFLASIIFSPMALSKNGLKKHHVAPQHHKAVVSKKHHKAKKHVYVKHALKAKHHPAKVTAVTPVIKKKSVITKVQPVKSNQDAGSNANKLTVAQVKKIVNSTPHSDFHPQVTPEVVKKINHFRTNDGARKSIKVALKNMKRYESAIKYNLESRSLPKALLAIPIIESRYQPLPSSANKRSSAAGVWQLLRGTAKSYGLVVNKNQDQRLNTSLETIAATKMFESLYDQFHSWELAVAAYNQGPGTIQHLIKKVGSRNVWQLIRSQYSKKELKNYVPNFNAAAIIIDHPEIIDAQSA